MSSSSSSSAAAGLIFDRSWRARLRDERHDLSSSEYLETYHVSTYIQDVVQVLLNRRDENSVGAMYDYFSSVIRGDVVVGRNFDFVSATPRNRLVNLIYFADHDITAF